MKRQLPIVLVALLAAITGFSGSASAQHGAGGPGSGARGPSGPEPASVSMDAEVAASTISVKVVAGGLDKPLADVEVVLDGLPTGSIRAQSDVDGTVAFALDSGIVGSTRLTVSAKAKGVEMRSEVFRVVGEQGVSIVLTTKAIGPGRGGRPSTRMMSGRARPEQNDPSGQLTIRAVTGELTQSKFGGLTAEIPAGALIHLVGMHADGSMVVQSEKVVEDKEGRVVFKKLARDNSVAYYAMTTYERAGGTDRLMTPVLKMAPQIGSRMMFAGRLANSATPGLDDLAELAGVDIPMPAAGNVIVKIYAETSQAEYLAQTSSVELIEIGKSDASKSAATHSAPPNSNRVFGQSGPMKTLPGTEPGQVSFYVARPSTDSAIAGAKIVVEAISAAGDVSPTPIESMTTGKDGIVHFRGLSAGKYVAIATLHGKELRSETFSIEADKALSFAFAFQWQEESLLQAEFEDIAHGADKIYIAKVFANGRSFLSMPFQMTKERGAAVGIYMYPELLFSLHGGGQLDDKRMWFQTQISLANPGIAPLKVSGSGHTIPLPKGFIGASVSDEMASRVGVLPDKGFLWRGAVPPGQQDFVANFALPVEGGKVVFDMALPLGLRGGRIVIDDVPGMELRTPGGAEAHAKERPNGMKFLEMSDLNIAPMQRLKFAIRGLPQASIWKSYARTGVGVVVLLLLIWATVVVFFDNKSIDENDPILASLEATRETLLEQMVALESEYRHKRGDDKEKPYRKQRDKLNTRLVAIYRKIDAHKSDDQSAN